MLQSSRPSLWALARQMGRAHQLLSHYLQQWKKSQARELRREANEIGGRAEKETRPRVRDEMLKQVTAYESAALHCSLDAALERCIRQLRREGKRGHLSSARCSRPSLVRDTREHRKFSRIGSSWRKSQKIICRSPSDERGGPHE